MNPQLMQLAATTGTKAVGSALGRTRTRTRTRIVLARTLCEVRGQLPPGKGSLTGSVRMWIHIIGNTRTRRAKLDRHSSER
ncbi:hypothetical protein ACWD4G_40895 [Streptomyces sp. NPDC002643]